MDAQILFNIDKFIFRYSNACVDFTATCWRWYLMNVCDPTQGFLKGLVIKLVTQLPKVSVPCKSSIVDIM